MNKKSQNSGIAYIPERYKQQIEAKKRRRFVKKIAIICVFLATCIVLYLELSGLLPELDQIPFSLPGSLVPSPEISPATPPGDSLRTLTYNGTAGEDTGISTGNGVPDQPTRNMLSPANATGFLRLDYPTPAYTLISVNVTNRYLYRSLYEFRVRLSNATPADTGFTAFIDAITGDLYTPGQENAKITADQAKILIQESFFSLYPDNIRLRYNNNTDTIRAWIFTLYRENAEILTGTMDPDTGEIVSFSRSIQFEGRQANPLLDINAAEKIADRYIVEKNRVPLPLNMSEARYDPLEFPQKTVAGQYVFVYNRIVQDIPCDNDGFTISVDSITGDVTGYYRRWFTPDSAFSVAPAPLVSRSAAIFTVLKKAQEKYPTSVIEILSAEIRWKDQYPTGSIPRPGTIPLAWKVQFTDEIIHAKETRVTATGWVDVQTGKIIEFYYQH
ncbi:MAG: hypothetical protein LUQ04_01125 [Methanoregula sp.]|nr:hypothetical protein [Methanoregula sp.]